MTLSYIDNTDDAIKEHVHFLAGKNLHEVWPDKKDNNQVRILSKDLQPKRPQEVSRSLALFIFYLEQVEFVKVSTFDSQFLINMILFLFVSLK